QSDLSGLLWVDQAFGEFWRFDLKTGAAQRVAATGPDFPAQPALTRNCAVQARMSGARLADGFANRFGIVVGATPVLSVTDDTSYQDPALAPDGRTLFVTRVRSMSANATQPGSGADILQVPLTGVGEMRVVVTDAMQPIVSPNGARLAYIGLDVSAPPTVTRQLRVRDLAGGAEFAVLPSERFYDIFGPRWLDDSRLIFAALEQSPLPARAPAPASLVDLLFGISIAHAHTWVGDVWIVDADGSGLHKLTPQPLQAPIPAPSPDGAWIALLAGEGVFVMNADGSGYRQISSAGGNGGIVWCVE
ncbi:MAG: hypothetical protein NTZ50_10690, partial [Chloroflexi bacterium]|nr:hypothetical protein [Chloroflexota bacterium]